MELSAETLSKYASLIVPALLSIISLIGMVAVFFLTRYIQRRDLFEEESKRKLEEAEVQFREQFATLAAHVKGEADKMGESAENIRSDSLTFRKSQLDFQETTQRELMKMHRAATEFSRHLRGALESSQMTATRLDTALERIGTAIEKLESCQSRDTIQEEAIRGTIKLLRVLKNEIEPQTMLTKLREIAPDIILVGQRKGPGTD